jgi:putative ABC transport system permease protein
LLHPGGVQRVNEARLDTAVFVFGFALSFLVGALAGIIPALRCTQVHLNQVIKERSSRLLVPRQVLIVGEIGSALVLLIGAGLFLRSIALLQAVHPGFDPDRLLTSTVS